MPLTEVQTLYERIATYKDPKVKAQLQALLKQERPDLKPKIDARQFLQCVAFGQQNEAQALLTEDVDSAQELLLADNLSFTDYSGRTFTCTAYEYAYWAKDTHMCRMLEKYMDNATKHELLRRVQRIEELVGEGLFKAPRGLTYTQNGKEHRSAHFDLKPLKDALKAYISAYTHDATDREALGTLWRKVGLPQRDVPAHIAQEYCHPNRSFQAVAKEAATQKSTLLDAANPNNLVRQLKFYNTGTGANDSWFTPDSYSSNSGLGFSFVIVRGPRARVPVAASTWLGADGGRADNVCSWILHDLAAIDAIDKARTDDLKQSLANLAAPSSLLVDPFSAS
nr:hypothetical protein cemce18_00013 [uncultured bacterium]